MPLLHHFDRRPQPQITLEGSGTMSGAGHIYSPLNFREPLPTGWQYVGVDLSSNDQWRSGKDGMLHEELYLAPDGTTTMIRHMGLGETVMGRLAQMQAELADAEEVGSSDPDILARWIDYDPSEPAVVTSIIELETNGRIRLVHPVVPADRAARRHSMQTVLGFE